MKYYNSDRLHATQMFAYVCVYNLFNTIIGALQVDSAVCSHIEARLRAVRQHQRDRAIVDPDQLGQAHRIQARHVRNRCGRVALDAACLRLAQSEHACRVYPAA